jgi:hypothetical protein
MAAPHVSMAAADAERSAADAGATGFALWIVAFGVFFVAFACAAIVIGLHDVALAEADLRVTVTSAALLALGAVSLVAACQLVGLSRRMRWEAATRPACKPPVLIGFLLVLLAAVYVFLSGIRATGDQRLVVAGAGLILVAVAVAGLVAFGSEARVTAPRVGAVALGLVGAIVSAWQFWYQNEYAPSQAGRAVALQADIVRETAQANTVVVRATLSFEAVSGRSLSVVGSAYTLTGARVVGCDRRGRRADAAEVAGVFNGFLLDPQRSRFAADVREQQPSTLLAAGKFVGDGRRLEPEVPYVREIVFHVARGQYQLLRFRAELFAISGAVNLSQRTVPQYELGREGFLYGFWRVDDDSWLRDLIYGRERWLVIRYELVREPGNTKAAPDVRVTARLTDPTWRHGTPSIDQARALFTRQRLSDPAEPFAATELPLGDVAAPTRDDTLPRACRR